MKSMMKKTTLREIRESLGRYLAIMAIVALGVGLFAGLKITKTVMVGSADAFWQAQQLYDYRLVSTLGFEEEDVQALAQKADVRAVQGAMEADVLYTDEQGNDKVLKAHSILENINMLETVAGRLPESDTECVVDDHLYGEEVIGSKIVLSGDNDQDDLDSFRYTEYTIVGTVRSPLYVQFERGTTSLGNGSVSGFVYLLPEGFATDYYTDIYVKFEEDAQVYSDEYDAYMDEREAQWETYCEEQGERRYQSIMTEAEEELADAEQKLADARADIADIEKPDTYVLGRETNTGYVCFESDSSIVEGIANVFPVFFFLVAALVCMTTMNRMVEEQRTQIGVLKALGYGEARIMGKYLFYSGSAASTGCVAGYLAGIRLFPLVIWQAYGVMYRFGGIVYAFDWATAVLCLAVSLLCSMGTTWASCRHELREVAAELMRPKSPKAGKRIFLEWIPFIWNRMKFLHKVSVRNIIRYKRRFLMMVIGISGCTALLLTGFAIRDSVTTVADRQFEEIQTYAVGVTLKDGVTKEDLSLLEELDQIVADNGGDYGLAVETSMDLETADGIKSVKLIAAAEPESFGAYFDLHTPAGEPIAYPQAGEVVICNKLSERYRIRAGDTITLFNEDREELQAVVSGVCENYIYNYVYVNEETYRKATGETGYQSVYVNLPAEADVYGVGASLMKAEHVTAVAVNRDMLLRVSRMMTSMNYIVFVIIACAGALAFIVLYNLNNINITERIREIATIKVLGFYKKETATYVFRENTVLTGIGCAVGLVLGRLLHIYVMHEVDIDMMSFDVHVEPVSYLLSILLTFVFTWLINRIMSGKLDKINMAESLKSVD